MTAMSLRNFPARNALRVVKQNQKMTIVTCILYLLGIPLAIAAGMITVIDDSREHPLSLYIQNTEMYAVLGMLFLGIAVFMGLFAAILSFSELHKKTRVDMLYALPLTGKQRFFSDYIGGCLMYIIPYLISVILGWIIIFCMAPFVNWQGTEYTFGTFMAEAGKMYAMATIGLLALMLLYYTLSVFVTVCCGTLFESIYTNILLNCLIPGALALVLAIISDEVGLGFEDMWQVVGFTSPIGGLIYLILLLAGELDGISDFASNAYQFAATQNGAAHAMLPTYLRWIFVILLLTAVLLIVAWQLYVRRKAEEVGKPFIYVAAYYVMLTLVTILILCMLKAGAIGPALILSAIVYFVMEVIRRRGFKRFWLSLITYAATILVSIAGFYLVVATGCFGRVSYVPAAIGVKSVVLEFEDVNNNRFDYMLEYTDADIISGVTELHRQIIQDEKNSVNYALNRQMLEERWCELDYNTYNDPQRGLYETTLPYYGGYGEYVWNEYGERVENEAWTWDPYLPVPDGVYAEYGRTSRVSITYYTVAGTWVHRSYSLNADQMQKLLQLVYGTPLYAQARADGLRARLNDEYKVSDWDAPNYGKIPSRITFVTRSNTQGNNMAHSAKLDNAPENLERLAAAYQSDLEQMTAQDFATAEFYCYINQLEVYTCCKNTIAVLDSFGIEPFKVSERYAFQDAENADMIYTEGTAASDTSANFWGIRIYTPEMSRTASALYPHSTASTIYFQSGEPAYEAIMYAGTSVSLEKEYPEMYALLGALRSNYVTDEDCYVVVIRGKSYILPKGQEELAQAVIAKGYGWNPYGSEEAPRVIGAGGESTTGVLWSDEDGWMDESYIWHSWDDMTWSDEDGWMDESGNWHAWDEEWVEDVEIWN